MLNFKGVADYWKNLPQRTRMTVFIFSLVLVGGVSGIDWWLSRPVIYECIDLRTKLPVFIVIEASGYTNVSAHDKDGQIYSYSGLIKNYDRFAGSAILFNSYPSKSVYLDRRTGSFSITVDDDELVLYSGVCK